MVYHIFNYRIGEEWYRDSVTYSDQEFERIMDKFQWKLPVGIRVYHFGAPGSKWYPLVNPVVLKRQILSIEPLSLMETKPRRRTAVHDKLRQREYPVLYQLGRYLLYQREDGWPCFCYADGERISINTSLEVAPISFRDARAYVERYHRHCAAPQGHKFSIGIYEPFGALVGVVVTSIPKARALNDGRTLEVNRVCCDCAYHNAASKLYGAAIRAGRAMGYQCFVTYTLPSESGSSLRAVGFRLDGMTSVHADGWNSPSRPRDTDGKYPCCRKNRWILDSKG